MHRVELKVESLEKKKQEIGRFLMHRVELKVELLLPLGESCFCWFLMHRVELKACCGAKPCATACLFLMHRVELKAVIFPKVAVSYFSS